MRSKSSASEVSRVFLERLGLALQFERRAVDLRRQRRLHVDVDRVRQVGDERNAQADGGDLVPLLLRAVVEVDPAVDDLDVVQREPRRRLVGLRRVDDPVDEVLDVVALVLVADQAQVRPRQAHPVEHRRQPVDRGQRGVDEQLVKGHERRVGVALAHHEALHRRAQRERVDAHPLDRDLAVGLLREHLLDLALEEDGRGEETEQCDGGQRDRQSDREADEHPAALRCRARNCGRNRRRHGAAARASLSTERSEAQCRVLVHAGHDAVAATAPGRSGAGRESAPVPAASPGRSREMRRAAPLGFAKRTSTARCCLRGT
jgi:hypothetical protein